MTQSKNNCRVFSKKTSKLFRWTWLALCWAVVCLLNPAAWGGSVLDGIRLPAGFRATTYFSASGFDPDSTRNVPGLPAIVSFKFDHAGNLYFARTANRLREIYDRDAAPIYRVPFGVTHIDPGSEKAFLFGPPLKDPDELGVNPKGEVFVSSSDAQNGYGTVYLLKPDGEVRGFVGGPPHSDAKALFMDPEGITFDPAGIVYVIDFDLGAIVKLAANGTVLNPKFVTGLGRGRTLTYDPRGFLWVGTDGPHDTPHMDGSGRIYRAALPGGELTLLHSGPLPSGMSLSPGGNLFVAQRRSGKLFALTAEGKHVAFASFSRRSALRTLAFPPITDKTKQAGIAGDLFVMVFPMLDYPVREIIRISGPFDAYVQRN